jgi:hypothetical protein
MSARRVRTRGGYVAILMSSCLVPAACGSPQDPLFDRPQCDSNQESRAGRLQNNPALIGEPDGVERSTNYRKLPCEDEDGVGVVGWNGMFGLASEVMIRDYYKKTLPEIGWALKGEGSQQKLAPGKLDAGRPQLCFESDHEEGVALLVFLDPGAQERQIFVELRFGPRRIACANYPS